jgi:hypothetical protein
MYTKLNSFLLRQYDAVIGRWTTTDPKNQYFSPYVGMGNNPVSHIDKDGGYAIVDDFIFGFFKGLFSRNPSNDGALNNGLRQGVESAKNSIKLWSSFVSVDSKKTVMGKTLQIASKFTWELPQEFLGILGGHSLGYIFGVKSINNFRGATILQTNTTPKNGFSWGFTVGSVITISRNGKGLINHEYGHYIASRQSGPLFIPLNFLSPFSAMIGERFHESMPWEMWADLNGRFLK